MTLTGMHFLKPFCKNVDNYIYKKMLRFPKADFKKVIYLKKKVHVQVPRGGFGL